MPQNKHIGRTTSADELTLMLLAWVARHSLIDAYLYPFDLLL